MDGAVVERINSIQKDTNKKINSKIKLKINKWQYKIYSEIRIISLKFINMAPPGRFIECVIVLSMVLVQIRAISNVESNVQVIITSIPN